jgi:hypothetical protein
VITFNLARFEMMSLSHPAISENCVLTTSSPRTRKWTRERNANLNREQKNP